MDEPTLYDQSEFDIPEQALHEKRFALDTLERYSGSPIALFQPYLLLTNFPNYVEWFQKTYPSEVFEGAMFKVAHCRELGISILDFKIGSPAAALVVDLVSFLPVYATLLLGMCGGLREDYNIGEYFVPVASIRGDGTSDFYFPSDVPALANFTVQKAVTAALELDKKVHHIGITYTTNKRFWEFNQDFRLKLQNTRSQAVEMECATLFTASYSHRLPLGALLLISDIPLTPKGVKTKQSSEHIFKTFMPEHINLGIQIVKNLQTIDRLKEYRKHVH
jgi:AMP nucleosidase